MGVKSSFVVEPLNAHHDRRAFSCGVPALNDYLHRQAGQDQQRKVTACYVAVLPTEPARIHGCYTLSTYGVRLGELPAEVSRRLPKYPTIPAALLGRLAVDRRDQRQGLGELLLMDALHRTLRVAGSIGLYAVVVDAQDTAAAAFYRRYDFRPFSGEPLRLFIPLATVAAAFEGN